jgi:hypothetical protein
VGAVVTGVLFFFPGFVFSLPITTFWAVHYYAGEAQAVLGGLFPSFIIGIVAAVACTIHLLRKPNPKKA